MKQMKYFPYIFFIINFCCLTFLHSESKSSLYGSVRKYKNHTVNQHAINRLSEYDIFIRYFTDFSYFVPRHKVSPDFIRALILAESGANPKAVSNKNALGLGQILLSTGREAGKELAKSTTTFRYVSRNTLANLKKNDLLNPAVNILLTCYLIAKYNQRFDGKLHLVLTAWNAGENTESLSDGRHAPYKETEDLIGKVNGYYVYLLRNKVFQ